MKDIIVRNLKRAHDDDHEVTSAQIDLGDTVFEVWYKLPHGSRLAEGSETMLVAALLPAMRLGRGVRIDAPVSPRLLSTLPAIQEIFRAWDPQFKKVPIHAQPAPPHHAPGADVGLFFSAGLDSFYSLLKHRDEITQLIFVYGFDMPMSDHAVRAKISTLIQEVAKEFRKPLLFVDTNIKEFYRRYVPWHLAFGAALASVGLLLSDQFRKLYIAAPQSYATSIATSFPTGSHPLLDPLWGTENIQFIHDGCEATRVEKAKRVASCDSALRSLRVCWERRDGISNCGQCEKCLRTMVNFRIAGALARVSTFARPLDLRSVSRMAIPNADIRCFAEDSLRAAEETGTDPALVKALRDCLDGRYYRGVWRIAPAGRSLARVGRRLLRRLAGR